MITAFKVGEYVPLQVLNGDPLVWHSHDGFKDEWISLSYPLRVLAGI